MQIGKEQQTRAKIFVFAGQWLLDLHDHFSLGPYIAHWQHARASLGKFVIANTAAKPCSAFYQNLVPVVSERLDPGGRDAHTVFIGLDLLGDANNHG